MRAKWAFSGKPAEMQVRVSMCIGKTPYNLRDGCFSGARNIFNYNAAVSELAWWTRAAIWWGVAASPASAPRYAAATRPAGRVGRTLL
jgi:hypothetical protein